LAVFPDDLFESSEAAVFFRAWLLASFEASWILLAARAGRYPSLGQAKALILEKEE
jgi:hypothetical protein